MSREIPIFEFCLLGSPSDEIVISEASMEESGAVKDDRNLKMEFIGNILEVFRPKNSK